MLVGTVVVVVLDVVDVVVLEVVEVVVLEVVEVEVLDVVLVVDEVVLEVELVEEWWFGEAVLGPRTARAAATPSAQSMTSPATLATTKRNGRRLRGFTGIPPRAIRGVSQ